MVDEKLDELQKEEKPELFHSWLPMLVKDLFLISLLGEATLDNGEVDGWNAGMCFEFDHIPLPFAHFQN